MKWLIYLAFATYLLAPSGVALAQGGANPVSACTGVSGSERQRFECFLREYRNAPSQAERDRVNNAIVNAFERDAAPMVVDLSGFGSRVREQPVQHVLAGVYEIWDAVRPIVQRHAGVILKDEADTLYAVFGDVRSALTAAVEIEDQLARIAAAQPPSWRTQDKSYCSSIGIGYGRILQIGTTDAFGEEVNNAYQAGEVDAAHGSILLTRAAMVQLAGASVPGVRSFRELNFGPYMSWRAERATPLACYRGQSTDS